MHAHYTTTLLTPHKTHTQRTQ